MFIRFALGLIYAIIAIYTYVSMVHEEGGEVPPSRLEQLRVHAIMVAASALWPVTLAMTMYFAAKEDMP